MVHMAFQHPRVGRCAAVLLVLFATGTAADGRNLQGLSIISGGPDPLDDMTGAPAPGSAGWNIDNADEVAAGMMAVGQHTTAAPQSASRKTIGIFTLLLGTGAVAAFLSYVSYIMCWKRGCFGQSDPTSAQSMFLVSVGIIIGLSMSGGVLIFAFGSQDHPVGVFKSLGNAFDTIEDIPISINNMLHPAPATTTLSPASLMKINMQMEKARDAMTNVKKLEAQLAAASAKLASQGSFSSQSNAGLEALQGKLAEAQRNAQQEARNAMPYVPTPRPEESGYGMGPGSGGYGAAPAYSGGGYGAPAPAAAGPMAGPPVPMGSPCATTTPSAVKTGPATVAPPEVVNFMPPMGCECKAAYGSDGKTFKNHCWRYKGLFHNQPVCVLKDPSCGGTTEDAGLGNDDEVVMCIKAEEGGVMYQIKLDRSVTDNHLGFNVAPDSSLKNLIITELSDSTGLVGLWNSANPAQAVKAGDLITGINGHAGSSVSLMKQLIQKVMLNMVLLNQNGYPIQLTPASAVVAAPPAQPASFPTGKCTKEGHGWGDKSICIEGNPGYPAQWHCPWESMMLMSTKAFGGCPKIGPKIDCKGTNTEAVLGLYEAHDNNKTHPPEGSLKTVEYAHCCIKHQCKNGPSCGPGFWVQGKSVSPWVGAANPCGAAGCERLYTRWPSIAALGSKLSSIPAFLAIAASLAGVALLLRRGRRAAVADAHSLLCTAEEDIEELMDQEAAIIRSE